MSNIYDIYNIYDIPVFKSSFKLINNSDNKNNVDNNFYKKNDENYNIKNIDIDDIYNLEPYTNINIYKKIYNDKNIQYLLLLIIIFILILNFI